MRTSFSLALVLILATLSSCDSTGNSRRKKAKPDPGAKLTHKVHNFRAILRQANSDAIFILVNENHELRQTREGRRQLTLGNSSQAYKALTDQNINGLLTNFEQFNASVIEEPWVAGDEKLLTKPLTRDSGIRGVIVVENNGRRYKLMGRRPSGEGDALGRQKYTTFSKLKRVFFYWDTATSRAERADSAVVGSEKPETAPFNRRQPRD